MAKVKGYDWKPGWKFVHKRLLPPAQCGRGQYASASQKGVQVVVCCPSGTKMDKRTKCCKRNGACVTKARAQAVRIPIWTFSKKHPAIWKRLIKKSGGK